MKRTNKILVFLIIGSVFSLFGIVGQILEIPYSPIMFSIGALIIIALKFMAMQNATPVKKREQRLAKIDFFASLLLGGASVLMFTDTNAWVVAVLIYAVISFFLTFRG